MKNWETLEADRVKLMNKHYSTGRGGGKVEMVVIHHNAGMLSIDQIWQVWQDRAASAHYQVQSDGVIGQLVWDRDTAWHAANQWVNQRSIGIEIANSGGAAQDWPISDKAIEEAAHLVAAILVYYKLGKPQVGKNIRYHREFTGTSCPHALAPGGRYNTKFLQRIDYWYTQMTKPAAKHAATKENPVAKVTDIIKSLVNPDKAFSQNMVLAFIDKATWEIRVLVKEIARKLDIDPEKLLQDAVEADRKAGK